MDIREHRKTLWLDLYHRSLDVRKNNSQENDLKLESSLEEFISDTYAYNVHKSSNVTRMCSPEEAHIFIQNMALYFNAEINAKMRDRIDIELEGDFSKNQKYAIIKYKLEDKTKFSLISLPDGLEFQNRFHESVSKCSFVYQHNRLGWLLGKEKGCTEKKGVMTTRDHAELKKEDFKLQNGEYVIVGGGYIANKNTSKVLELIQSNVSSELYLKGVSESQLILESIIQNEGFVFNGDSGSYDCGNMLGKYMLNQKGLTAVIVPYELHKNAL